MKAFRIAQFSKNSKIQKITVKKFFFQNFDTGFLLIGVFRVYSRSFIAKLAETKSRLLQKSTLNPSTDITITGSKSESNRLLLLKALFKNLEIQNVSNSDDSQYMLKALKSETPVVDIHHAGTAMRFLTAYFATLEGKTTLLTGSQRMQERPIKILVDTLKALGADIEYDKEEGYPPLRITGKPLLKDEVRMKANVSSQYISALLLMATKLKN